MRGQQRAAILTWSLAWEQRGNHEMVCRTEFQRRCQFPEGDPIHRSRGFRPRRSGGRPHRRACNSPSRRDGAVSLPTRTAQRFWLHPLAVGVSPLYVGQNGGAVRSDRHNGAFSTAPTMRSQRARKHDVLGRSHEEVCFPVARCVRRAGDTREPWQPIMGWCLVC
jgi:hypothetical protein